LSAIVVFEGSIGRTDLPGGNYEQLIKSIEDNILSLDDDFVVHSGHGRETTVGRERQMNPFLTGQYAPSGKIRLTCGYYRRQAKRENWRKA
jgi:glyoxylase-like metal-dependent hydrolase (beta-lactamase superfamily II)